MSVCYSHTAFRNSLSRPYFESRMVVAYVDLKQDNLVGERVTKVTINREIREDQHN